MILSDEIYSRLLFEGEPYSIASVPGIQGAHHHSRRLLEDLLDDRLATGLWRDAAGPGTHIARLATNSTSCTATFTQIAGIEAVSGDQSEPERMRQEFLKRRDVFVDGLNKIKGFSCRLPKGAFYTFPNIKQTGWPSKKLADALLDQAGVAALSGTAFGSFGEGYLRFSIANSIEHLQEALRASTSGRRRICKEEESVALKGRSFSCAVRVLNMIGWSIDSAVHKSPTQKRLSS